MYISAHVRNSGKISSVRHVFLKICVVLAQIETVHAKKVVFANLIRVPTFQVNANVESGQAVDDINLRNNTKNAWMRM